MKSRAQDFSSSPVLEFDTLPSTNEYLLSLPDQQAVAGMTCIARNQSAGRGRGDRTWSSPPGGVYLSILMKPTLPFTKWHLLSLAMACAGAEAIATVHPDLSPSLKWPNDILISGRKVAGILAQSTSGANPRIVTGIGINVASRPELLPVRPLYPATVINLESSYPCSEKHLIQAVRSNFYRYFELWTTSTDALLNKWTLLCDHLNKQVVLSIDGKEVRGLFTGIDADGAMLLDSHGSIEKYLVGDLLEIRETRQC